MLQDRIGLVISSGLLLAVAVASDHEANHPKVPTYNFKVSDINLSEGSYWEDFQAYSDKSSLEKRWLASQFEAVDPATSALRKQYVGEWDIEEPYRLKALQGDKGLVLKKSNVPAMIGSKLPTALHLEANDDLVVQYEVQLQNDLKCGGAFLKLLPLATDEDLSQYNGKSPVLELLFGPDMCPPYTDEIHLGIKKTNPYTMRPELKLLKQAPLSHLTDVSVAHLYTLLLKGKDRTFEIRVDGSVVKAGDLLDEGTFKPGFNAPKYIPDPEETKPVDWDERQFIPDPQAVKPEDWDESEPLQIPDEEHLKPDDWDESLPSIVPDSSRHRPQWWDDDKYGIWIAPMIENPECENISGCGEWIPRLVDNPRYRGPWEPPTVPNPNYQGTWEAQLIKNPEYYEDSVPAKLENPIGAIVFEFWSGTTDLVLDNIYVGKHIGEAESLGNATFIPKRKFQDEQLTSQLVNTARQPKAPPSEDVETSNFYDTIIDMAGEYLSTISDQFGVTTSTLALTLVAIVLGLFTLRRII